MIKFIIGENASGKSLYLDNLIKEDLRNHDKIEFVTNVYDIEYTNQIYNQNRLDVLENISDAEKVDTSNEILALMDSPVKLSKEFLQIMTIFCLECKRAYIDEPEQGLSEYEINLLSSFLMLTNNTFDEVVIVTHSELLIQIPNCELYTPKMNEITADITLHKVMEENKFEVID